MMLRPIISSLLVTCLAAQEEAADHLRFTNGDQLQGVMPAFVAGIHVFVSRRRKTWMAGTGPAR